jgi:hypothetical protein
MKLEGIHRQPKTYAVSVTRDRKASEIVQVGKKDPDAAETPMKTNIPEPAR